MTGRGPAIHGHAGPKNASCIFGMSAIHGGQNCSCISDAQEPECLGGHGDGMMPEVEQCRSNCRMEKAGIRWAGCPSASEAMDGRERPGHPWP